MDDPVETASHQNPAAFSQPPVAETNLAVGQLVDGRYKVLSLIGRGGMGSVYRVEQVFLHKEFALKTLVPGTMSPKSIMRFQAEAKATGSLNHPGLATVRDFGVLADCQPFLVMDYIDGEPLSARLHRVARLPLETALPILIQIAEALTYAHANGVIHRDLKPANVMLTEPHKGQIQVHIIDFGIAKMVNSYENGLPAITQTGEVFGSPMYMSPEQCAGTAIDARSDIYSFGCLMFETLTGTTPFFGNNAFATMLKQKTAEAPTLKEATLGIEFPADVERVLARLLKKNPDERYQDIADVADHLKRIKNKTRVFADDNLPAEPKPAIKPNSVETSKLAPALGALCLVLGVSCLYLGSQVISLSSQLKELKANSAHQNSTDSQFFSRVDGAEPRTRIFEFPQTPIGTIEIVKGLGAKADGIHATDEQVKAQGRVVIHDFTPGCLKLNFYDSLIKDPAILEKFRTDEVGALNLPRQQIFGEDAVSEKASDRDNMLQHVDHLESLDDLDVGESPLTNACLTHVARIEGLKKLSVANTNITGDGVAKLPQLKQLVDVNITTTEHARAAINALKGSTAIKYLSLGQDDINDDDLQTVSTLPNLKYLDLKGTKFSTAGIVSLAKLKHLSEVDVQRCSLKSSDLDLLKRGRTVHASEPETPVTKEEQDNTAELTRNLPKFQPQ